MEEVTPEKLFACICKIHPNYAEKFAKFFEEGAPLPSELQAIRLEHVRYYEDLCKKGILWLAGSWADHSGGLQIFAVDSIEKAREVQQNDPLLINGIMYDDTYFEWTIHVPYKKVPPALREKIAQTLRECGIEPEP